MDINQEVRKHFKFMACSLPSRVVGMVRGGIIFLEITTSEEEKIYYYNLLNEARDNGLTDGILHEVGESLEILQWVIL